MLKKIMFIVLGKIGYVGSKLFHFLKDNAKDVVGLSRAELDYTNVKKLREFLRWKNPDI